MAGKRRGGFTVTGPDVDREGLESEGMAFSYGITVATRHAIQDEGEATFYLRDPQGEAVGRIERAADGTIYIHSNGRSR